MDTQSKLEPYACEGKSVVVYNTYADRRKIHSDGFVPIDKTRTSQLSQDMDSRVVEYAKEFLQLLGKPTVKVQVNMCECRHIDNTGLFVGQLWKLPATNVEIVNLREYIIM